MDKIGVVLVNYNGEEYLPKCIECLTRQTYKNIEIIVVDNHSQDHSLNYIESHSEIHLIKNNMNLGFGCGCNIGIKAAIERGANYILLLNTDTVVEDDLIAILLENADENTVVAPRMYRGVNADETEILWYAGGNIDYTTSRIDQLTYVAETKNGDLSPRIVDFITGCCMLVPKEIFEKIGYFSSEYFMYYEDADFCMRIKEKGGRMLYVPTVGLWHKVGGSADAEVSCLSQYYVTRNRLYFIDKFTNLFHMSSLQVLKNILQERGYLKTNNKYDIYIEAGIRDFLEDHMGEGYYGSQLLFQNYYLRKGFYELEKNDIDSWNWASQQRTEIIITNPSKWKKKYKVFFVLSPPPGGDICNTKIFVGENLVENIIMPQKIYLHLEMEPESMKIIRIETENPMIDMSETGDFRQLAFQIMNFVMKETDE